MGRSPRSADRDGARVFSVLREQYAHDVRMITERTLGRSELPARKRSCVSLLQKEASATAVVEGLRALAGERSRSSEDFFAYQRQSWVLGPLGIARSRARRTHYEAHELLRFITTSIGKEKWRRALVTRLARERASMQDALRRCKPLRAGASSCARLAILLQATDDEIALAINGMIAANEIELDLGGEVVYQPNERTGDPEPPWRVVTRWGVADRPEGKAHYDAFRDALPHKARALAVLIDNLPSVRAINREVVDFHAPTRLDKIHEFVVAQTPRDAIKRCFSHVELWELAADCGLSLPPPGEITPDTLQLIALRLIDLGITRVPKGLYSLRKLLDRGARDGSPERRPGDPWEVLASFEAGYGGMLAAYISAFLLRPGDSSGEVVCADAILKDEVGLQHVEECELELPEQRPAVRRLSELTLGNKVRLFRSVISRIEESPEAVALLERTGRRIDQLRRLVGEDVLTLVKLRNQIAHHRWHGSSDPVTVIGNGLDALFGDDDRLVGSLVPMRVVLECMTLDDTGWVRTTLLDELGRRLAVEHDALPDDSVSFGATYYLFAGTNPVLAAPLLV